LLNRLVGEIKFLDTQHRELFTTHKMPMRLEESKKKITDIRKELDRFLKDCLAIKT
jgi:hemerythrin